MKRVYVDALRIAVLMVLTGVLLYLADPSNVVVFQAMGIAVFFVGATHLTRRVLFNRLDVQLIAQKAIDDANFPAAVIFCAIIYFLVQVFDLSMAVLR